jgi:hypothetical protein
MLGSRLQLAVSALMMGKSVMAAVHVVTVGKGDHDFSPKIVTADPGDIICEFIAISAFICSSEFENL